MSSDPAPRQAQPDARTGPVSLDVVIPVWNEEDVLRLLFDRLRSAFSPEACARSGIGSVRFVLVDDGSRDQTAVLIRSEIDAGLPAVLLRLSRNFGHQAAVSAGLDHATADLVAVIDADLQDPPELIHDMAARWREGHDVVYGVRRRRQENVLKVAAYWAFYRLVALLSDIRMPLDGGDFGLMDKRVVRELRALPETLRFPRVLRAWVGFRQAGLEYDRPGRQAGRTKYTLRRLYRLATDGVVSSSVRPLQLAQVFSFSYFILMFVLGLVILRRYLFADGHGLPPSLLVTYLLIVSGNFVQALCMYILGAYVGRTYLEVKRRPAYLVMETVGLARRDA
ncbi:MAG TPA: glycosyltransferase family 2 protein [Vicinamibacteria bacterium]|nr:glycosyltransferase family 2 protein [Vicinamibacteria bacterium]